MQYNRAQLKNSHLADAVLPGNITSQLFIKKTFDHFRKLGSLFSSLKAVQT